MRERGGNKLTPIAITGGSSLFAKLQFQSSTPAGKEFFFRIVACLVAKTPKSSHMLMAKVSSPIFRYLLFPLYSFYFPFEANRYPQN